MTEYGTIKIPKAEYDKHNARRKEMGLEWAEYIDGQAPDIQGAVREAVREELARAE